MVFHYISPKLNSCLDEKSPDIMFVPKSKSFIDFGKMIKTPFVIIPSVCFPALILFRPYEILFLEIEKDRSSRPKVFCKSFL